MGFAHCFSVFIGVASGLSFLHGSGVWHGNLKPNNILVSDSHGDFTAMICDLSFAPGAARAMESMKAESVSMAYMAPELWRATTAGRLPKLSLCDGSRCDMYSLGLLMWEALSGHTARHYPKALNDFQLSTAVAKGTEPEGLEHFDGGDRTTAPISPARRLYSLIRSCLQVEGTNRPSAADVAKELQQLQGLLLGLSASADKL